MSEFPKYVYQQIPEAYSLESKNSINKKEKEYDEILKNDPIEDPINHSIKYQTISKKHSEML